VRLIRVERYPLRLSWRYVALLSAAAVAITVPVMFLFGYLGEQLVPDKWWEFPLLLASAMVVSVTAWLLVLGRLAKRQHERSQPS
jgi:hypothetical protein